jgi:hypothetical protein
MESAWCARKDLHLHGSLHWFLRPARLLLRHVRMSGVRDLGNAPSESAVSQRCRRLLAHLAGYSTRESNPAARPYQDRQINQIVVLCESSCAAQVPALARDGYKPSLGTGPRRARYGTRGSNSSLQGVGLLPSPDGESRVGSGCTIRTRVFFVQSEAVLPLDDPGVVTRGLEPQPPAL